MLAVENGSAYYGSVAAISGISLRIAAGSTATIIGANGAGKTTLLRAISGLTQLKHGEIWFDGQRIDTLAAEDIVALGIAHVPEGRRVFPDLTVDENLRIGAYLQRDQAAVARQLAAIYGHFPRLAERTRQRAKTMSGGEQQMLAIGRALMSAPRLLLLDEPSMGLSPVMVQEIAAIITEIKQQAVTVVLVEQNAEMALQLSDYGYVLETGRMTLEGDSAALRGNDHVRKAYLGG